jgi:hypothetical protein
VNRIKCFMVEFAEEGTATARRGNSIRPTPTCRTARCITYKPRQVPGPDGRYLFVVTPGGVWAIDLKANNCTRRDDWNHHCWVRHGVPPEITVDKNGETCGCGCSIGFDGPNGGYRYHGFLRNAYLEEC